MTDQRRIERVVILLTAEEKQRVKRAAGRQSISEYMREMALGDGSYERDLDPLSPEGLQAVKGVTEREGVPDKPGPPPRTQEKRDQEAPAQAEDFERRVARHAIRMPRRKAIAIVKKELGLDAPPSQQ